MANVPHTSGSDLLYDTIVQCAALRSCTDILLNGTQLWVDCGHGVTPHPLPPQVSDADVRRLAVRLAAQAERRLDEASPIVDARMPHGWRLHAVLPPVGAPHTLISIRIPRHQQLTLHDMVRFGWEPLIVDTIAQLIAARANVLVSGGTGSGKTTLLTAALSAVPHNERIVCIEEVPEIRPHHPHCVHLHERAANIQGRGAVGLSELVRAAMRMRPDRIVLGECRGSEVRDVMSALNTGHDGGWATIHANKPADVPARLGALGALAGLSEAAVASQAAAAFDAVIHLGRGPDGQRRVDTIATLAREGAGLACHDALTRSPNGDLVRASGWPDIARFVQGRVL